MFATHPCLSDVAIQSVKRIDNDIKEGAGHLRQFNGPAVDCRNKFADECFVDHHRLNPAGHHYFDLTHCLALEKVRKQSADNQRVQPSKPSRQTQVWAVGCGSVLSAVLD